MLFSVPSAIHPTVFARSRRRAEPFAANTLPRHRLVSLPFSSWPPATPTRAQTFDGARTEREGDDDTPLHFITTVCVIPPRKRGGAAEPARHLNHFRAYSDPPRPRYARTPRAPPRGQYKLMGGND